MTRTAQQIRDAWTEFYAVVVTTSEQIEAGASMSASIAAEDAAEIAVTRLRRAAERATPVERDVIITLRITIRTYLVGLQMGWEEREGDAKAFAPRLTSTMAIALQAVASLPS